MSVADETAKPLPVREIGSAKVAWWSDEFDTDTEETPELRWPENIRVYDRMRTTDPQIISVLRAITLPVLRTRWWIDGTGCRDEVTEQIADDFGLPIWGTDGAPAKRRNRDRFSWGEHLDHALLMLPFGHSFMEQNYRVEEPTPGAYQYRLRKLAPRMQRSIQAINVAPDGGLESIQQWGVKRPIPVDFLVAYVYQREGANWRGRSILRGSYKNWALKDRALRDWATRNNRNSLGIPLYRGAPGEADLASGRDIATNARNGANAGAAIPNGADFELVGVTGTLADLEAELRYHDEQIARSVLAHFLNLGTQTGSWALGSTFADFFTLSLQTIAQIIMDVTSMHVVEDLVDANWGPDEPAPTVRCDEIGSQQEATAQAIKMLLDAGALSNDPALERYLRNSYGLPPREDGYPATTPPATEVPA